MAQTSMPDHWRMSWVNHTVAVGTVLRRMPSPRITSFVASFNDDTQFPQQMLVIFIIMFRIRDHRPMHTMLCLGGQSRPTTRLW
jgi:hypothetical protein